MCKLLTRCLGVKGAVRKTRTLYMVDQTRVHVDSVDGLGDFMELEVGLQLSSVIWSMTYSSRCGRMLYIEHALVSGFSHCQVVLRDDQTVEDGEKIASDLRLKLGIKEEDLLSEAYMDMILKK